MINFDRKILQNGLVILANEDNLATNVAVNIVYNVGARNEQENRTGFAHLFEHLMFEGSVNIPSYDKPLQEAGGENNAWTNNDLTNYYLSINAENLELAFWLESDRMLSLDFSQHKLDIQKQVVIEEFNQRYLNQPYGDEWLLMRPLAYKVHPYKWATIGKNIAHIESASLADVEDFFFSFYAPNNAVLSVSGPVKPQYVFELAEKWFGNIPRRTINKAPVLPEPEQNERRFLEVERTVPMDSLMMTFHMCNRLHDDYPAWDLISDVLSVGGNSRFYSKLIKEKQAFVSLDAYISGSHDDGLFVIHGRPSNGTSLVQAEDLIWAELENLQKFGVRDTELIKVKNKTKSARLFGEISTTNKALNLGIYEVLGNANLVNEESEIYENVAKNQIEKVAVNGFKRDRASVLYYKSITE